MEQQTQQEGVNAEQQVAPQTLPTPDQQPPVPATSWNPPGGDIDFDSMFTRTGADGESVANSNAIPTEPTTTPKEPAKAEQTPASPKKEEYFLKEGDIVYKTKEDLLQGIRHKNENIERLRSMVSSVTGEDPLSKAGAKPGSTTFQTQPVSYLKDSHRYVEDLRKAADLGEKTGNWDPYRNIQAQLQFEVVQSTVGPYMPVVQNVGRQQALDDISRNTPEFRTFYNSDTYHKVLESRPKLAGLIQYAESQPTLQEELRELYQSVWDAAQASKLPELVKQQTTATQHPQTPQPRMPITSVARPSLQVPDQNRHVVEAPKPNLQTPAGRRAIIEEAERRGIADMQF